MKMCIRSVRPLGDPIISLCGKLFILVLVGQTSFSIGKNSLVIMEYAKCKEAADYILEQTPIRPVRNRFYSKVKKYQPFFPRF